MNALNCQLIENAAAYSTENQMLGYLNTFKEEIAGLGSLSQVYQSPELSRACFDNALFYNGFLLEHARRISHLVSGTDSLIQETYDRWQGCRRRLAAEYTKPIAERRFIVEVEEEAEGYEKTLTRNFADFGETRHVTRWQDVRNRLRADEAAIEFVHFNYFSPNITDSIIYAALILRPGWDSPQIMPLFEEKQLSGLLHGVDIASKANNLYATRGVEPVVGINMLSKNLYELIWRPLVKSLKGVNAVYFATSGLLSNLNLGAIPTYKDNTLSDQYKLVQLGSTRQLVVPQKGNNPSQTARLFGGIQYDLDTTTLNRSPNDLEQHDALVSRGILSFFNTDSSLRVSTWNYLPGTESEVVHLEKIIQTSGFEAQVLSEHNATEEAFKLVGNKGVSPRILHIATHGFFFPDPRTVGSRPSALGSEPVFKISEHPMIRSGLLLAGANHAWKTGKPFRAGMEDGILTAYEISQMNLSNTELVVLSACETGLGDIQGNEGVYGLQRAFKIAGAKYLIMSLWQVPDKQTSLLMTTFYKKWLEEEKMTIPEAFRAAQKELRDAGFDPYQWAGFVLVE